MCEHQNLIYIGSQETFKGNSIPLYNCAECHTTVVMKNSEKQRVVSNSASLEAAFCAR